VGLVSDPSECHHGRLEFARHCVPSHVQRVLEQMNVPACQCQPLSERLRLRTPRLSPGGAVRKWYEEPQLHIITCASLFLGGEHPMTYGYFLFLQEQIKDIIIINVLTGPGPGEPLKRRRWWWRRIYSYSTKQKANDTIQGPRAPEVKPGRITTSLTRVRAAPLSPVVNQSDFARFGRPSDDPPTPLRSSVDTGAGDRGRSLAEFAVVAETVGGREDVGSVVLR